MDLDSQTQLSNKAYLEKRLKCQSLKTQNHNPIDNISIHRNQRISNISLKNKVTVTTKVVKSRPTGTLVPSLY